MSLTTLQHSLLRSQLSLAILRDMKVYATNENIFLLSDGHQLKQIMDDLLKPYVFGKIFEGKHITLFLDRVSNGLYLVLILKNCMKYTSISIKPNTASSTFKVIRMKFIELKSLS